MYLHKNCSSCHYCSTFNQAQNEFLLSILLDRVLSLVMMVCHLLLVLCIVFLLLSRIDHDSKDDLVQQKKEYILIIYYFKINHIIFNQNEK